VFCSDGAVPIDNNVSEREMKRVVLNRKNGSLTSLRLSPAPKTFPVVYVALIEFAPRR